MREIEVEKNRKRYKDLSLRINTRDPVCRKNYNRGLAKDDVLEGG